MIDPKQCKQYLSMACWQARVDLHAVTLVMQALCTTTQSTRPLFHLSVACCLLNCCFVKLFVTASLLVSKQATPSHPSKDSTAQHARRWYPSELLHNRLLPSHQCIPVCPGQHTCASSDYLAAGLPPKTTVLLTPGPPDCMAAILLSSTSVTCISWFLRS